ncbi:MAG: phosphoribosylformylglycinamidine cyclo-ligase [Acidobacteriota bacterium]|nr:phosphoribosylformylglycinamidine cyclo-ligase [Acidobacteriota bacterium]MDH3523056.1 phosphoribosylformylglycinamidine cyclo-ligase [Acidobacteriota bacterium]
MSGSAYGKAGVDIDAQDEALARIGKAVRSTFTPGVLSDLGSFGGLFRPDLTGLEDPVLVASADGVGTKLMVARRAGNYSTVGRDLVNHCVNDILVQGARPLFFLDYVGAGTLDPRAMAALVSGVATGCRENGCALLGGETAEMPGFYQPGDYELAGFIVGLVDRAKILDGSGVRAGDLILGLPSAGLHTNGYSLARKVFFDVLGLEVGDRVPGAETRETVGELLLSPHLSYLAAVAPWLGDERLHALAHVTGGGLTDNLPRVLPPGLTAEIKVGAWEIPEVFYLLQEHGEVHTEEMFRVFNMGIGMALVVDPAAAGELMPALAAAGSVAAPIGTVQKGKGGVVYDFPPGSRGREGGQAGDPALR